MEKIIEEKMERQQMEDKYRDAFDYMLSSSKEHGHQLSLQELKVREEPDDSGASQIQSVPTSCLFGRKCPSLLLSWFCDLKGFCGRQNVHSSPIFLYLSPTLHVLLQETAVELIFAAHSTTASASTSLVLQLLRHPAVVERARTELEAEGLAYDSLGGPSDVTAEKDEDVGEAETSRLLNGSCPNQRRPGAGAPQSRSHVPYLSLDKLSRLCYTDCVVKEVLRFLPPVSGGYRTALQTFELDVSSSRKRFSDLSLSLHLICCVVPPT